ncbi:hypothetical protein KSS87_018190, partial [Heliosperma pusillum]
GWSAGDVGAVGWSAALVNRREEMGRDSAGARDGEEEEGGRGKGREAEDMSPRSVPPGSIGNLACSPLAYPPPHPSQPPALHGPDARVTKALLMNRKQFRLSDGQKHKVAIAGALAEACTVMWSSLHFRMRVISLGWRFDVGRGEGWRLEVGGWRLEVGGWRGWRLEGGVGRKIYLSFDSQID